MMRFRICAIVVAAGWISAGVLAAHDRQVLKKDFPADPQVKKISLTGDISAAEMHLVPHDGGDLFMGRVRYDADRTEVDITLDKSGSEAELEMTGKRLREKSLFKGEENDWDISLSRDYTWDINIDVGAADCLLDLSGLPVERMKLDAGASECEIVFDRPNPTAMKRLSIDAGAGSIKLHGLGYAQCEEFVLDGGAGSITADFDGFDQGFRTAHIDVSIGEVDIEIPEDLPARITTDEGLLNSVDIDDDIGESRGHGVWQSAGYEQGKYGLEISIDVGIGQVSVSRSR
jgi:hypothetical protein